MLLAWLMLIPVLAAIVIGLVPMRRPQHVAFLASLVPLALCAWGMLSGFDWSRGAEMQFQRVFPLVPGLGVTVSFGADGVSLWLVLLTCFLQPLCVLGSFSAITERPRAYYASLMALQGAMLGVFVARDLIFFYVCFEFTLVPMFVLISLWGSTNRKRAAIKFFLYTFTGSIIALAGLVYIAWCGARTTGAWDFSIDAMEATARGLGVAPQRWLLLALMCGFAVKVPLFPLHTWLPLAHTEAPAAGSVILAGVMLKLGTYAIYRFVLPMVPLAVVEHAGLIAVICIIGILYGGLICWVQRDVKKLVAYSSVAHLGFCMLGLFALNSVGAMGSVMYMLTHGLSTSALFFCIGMMYERYHTRSLDEIGGLAKRMPVWAFFVIFFTMSSVGLPGLDGFIAEFNCLLGAFQSGATRIGVGGAAGGTLGPWFSSVAATGMIVSSIYLLYMAGRFVWGPLREPAGHGGHGAHGGPGEPGAHASIDLTAREIGVLAPLALGCLLLGAFPTTVLRTLEAPVGRLIAGVEAAADSARAAAESQPEEAR